jgi:hypothetical protein
MADTLEYKSLVVKFRFACVKKILKNPLFQNKVK